MSLVLVTDPIPLLIAPDGVIRVGRTRVTLDTVISAFLEGATIEEIVEHPHFSQTWRSQSLKALCNKGLTPFKAVRKKQHSVETLIPRGFDQTRLIASIAFFVRNAGTVSSASAFRCLFSNWLLFTTQSRS